MNLDCGNQTTRKKQLRLGEIVKNIPPHKMEPKQQVGLGSNKLWSVAEDRLRQVMIKDGGTVGFPELRQIRVEVQSRSGPEVPES